MSFFEESEQLDTIMQNESIATEQYNPHDISLRSLKQLGGEDVESLSSDSTITENSIESVSIDSLLELFYDSFNTIDKGDNYRKKRAPKLINIQSMSSSEFKMDNNTSEIKLVSDSTEGNLEPQISNYFFEMSEDAFSSTSEDNNVSTIEQFSNIRQSNETSSIHLISEDGTKKKNNPKKNKKEKKNNSKTKQKQKQKGGFISMY